MSAPRISVAMPAYQAERWIGETLESVMGQTSAPDEVVVVDDGSTDRTSEVVRSFGDRVRLVQQANAGPPAAYNRGFRESTSAYVAMCPADDLWEPHKLEVQREALAKDPAIDVAFARARYFGIEERDFDAPQGEGILDTGTLFREMYWSDQIPAPTAVVRRAAWERLGGFREDLAAEDYEFWLRALRARAVFYFDRRVLARLRQHGGNVSSQALPMWEMNHRIHAEYAADLGDPGLTRRTLARDLRTIGRCRVGLGRARDARLAYRASAGHVPHPAAVAWTLLLSVPGSAAVAGRLAAHRRANAA